MAVTGAGLEGIVAAESGICYIDGDAGILSYQGYRIETLADHAKFEEVIFLLWNGRLPKQAELDKLMESQMTTTDYATRKRLYDRVQDIVAQNLPLVFLLSPDILVGAQSTVGNFRPGILDPYALWNVDELFLRPAGVACR